jgi:hypothetical protein
LRFQPRGLGETTTTACRDTLGMYPGEEKPISSALQNDALIEAARTGLANALARVQATDDKVNVVWGGGE